MQKERDVIDLGRAKFPIFLILSICNFLWSGAAVACAGDSIVIEFSSDNCPKCEQMHRTTDLAIEAGWVVRRFNVNRDQHIASRWQINNVPTTIVVRNGQEVDRMVGPMTFNEFQRRLENASNPAKPNSLSRNVENATIRGQSPLASVPVIASGAMSESSPRFNKDSITKSESLSEIAISKIDPKDASVRIRVSEQQQESVGSGTIIDIYQGEALVLTCGHLFRDSQGKASVSVETFINGQVQSYPATIIDFQAKEVDIGLLSFRPNGEIPTARLIPVTRRLSEGQRVFSFGCDHGAVPSRRDSRITKINRYLGSPNVEVEGQPAEGRSGGGLFDERGELIGVCYAADPRLGEGLYNGAEVVYQQLAKLGLQRLFHDEKSDRSQTNPRTSERSSSVHSESTRVPALTGNPVERPAQQEMTVILKDANGKQELIHIPHPSEQLLQSVRENFRRR